jgi:hypothetical protein
LYYVLSLLLSEFVVYLTFVSVSTPIGFTTLTGYGLKFFLPASTRHKLKEKIQALEFEEQVIMEKLKSTKYFAMFHNINKCLLSADQNNSNAEMELQQHRLEQVRNELGSLAHTRVHPFISNVLSLLVTVLNLSFAAYLED